MSDQLSLDVLRKTIVAQFPDLAGTRFTLLTAGWDSMAVDVDDRLIFKFPRDDEASEALRREARLLEAVRPVVTLAVPDLKLFEGPPLFSRHEKLPGEHLLAPEYEQLSEKQRDALAADIAGFYAQLHRLDSVTMAAAGAQETGEWEDIDETLDAALERMPAALHDFARKTVAALALLPPDPLGQVYGFFDGHGWNMAFDHAAGRLNGIYDFADSGFGDLHQEFIYTSFISPDLTERVIGRYEGLTGRVIDRQRVHILTGALRVQEMADPDISGDNFAMALETATIWAEHDARTMI